MVGYQVGDTEDKAGFNQAAKITEILAILRNTFLSSMLSSNFPMALESIRNILNVISGKVKEEVIEGFNKTIYEIEEWLEGTEVTYNYNGGIYHRNKELRRQVKREIENLYREVERIQDKYGYGMLSQEDPRKAVLKR